MMPMPPSGTARGRAVILALFVALAAGGPARAQLAQQPQPQPRPQPEQRERPASRSLRSVELAGRSQGRLEIEREIMDANQKLGAGRATQAIAQLERLHARYPGDLRVIVALADAYARGGEPLKAADALQSEIARSGAREPDLWAHLAMAYQLAGRGADATETLLAALQLTPDWLDRMQDQFEIAVTDSASGEAAMERLRRRALESGAPTVWREALAHVLLVTGRFEEAVGLVAAVDREKQARGRGLSELARAVARRGDPAVALAVFDSLLAHKPDAGEAEEAWFERGRLLERLGRPTEALASYETLARDFPRGNLAIQARLRAAAVQRGSLRDTAGARAAYRQILAEAPADSRNRLFKAIREEALLGLGECALQDGAFPEAESTFAALEGEAVQTSAKEHAAFERAELLFYSGRFADAEEAYYQLTDHYPAGEWVNDALGRALLLGEFGATAGVSLEAYAGVLYRERVGASEDALRLCREALRDTVHVEMRAYLRLEEIRITAGLGRWTEADAALALLLEQDPGSRVAPVALHLVATQAEAVPERRDRALELYEQVILRYPNSLEARQARSRLQALREPAQQS
jgi:tetratricopeptide (TPR) repeat protein